MLKLDFIDTVPKNIQLFTVLFALQRANEARCVNSVIFFDTVQDHNTSIPKATLQILYITASLLLTAAFSQ